MHVNIDKDIEIETELLSNVLIWLRFNLIVDVLFFVFKSNLF